MADDTSRVQPGTVHIAGLDVQVGPFLRQRCAWCGTVLIDHDLRRVAVQVEPDGSTKPMSTWPVGGLVCVYGNLSMAYVVEHENGANVPPNACSAIDPAVTA